MPWRLFDDLEVFRATVAPELSRAPVEHTLPLNVLDQLCRGIRWSERPLLLAAHDSGAAALRTPPRPLLLTAVAELEKLVALIGPTEVDGVNARASVARGFADACGRSATVRLRLHLLELRTLIPPSPPDRGAVRAATPADEEILWDFTCAMAAGLGEPEPPRDGLADRIAAGQAWLWEIGGKPVAFAGHTAPVAGVARVAPVYSSPSTAAVATPRRSRRRQPRARCAAPSASACSPTPPTRRPTPSTSGSVTAATPTTASCSRSSRPVAFGLGCIEIEEHFAEADDDGQPAVVKGSVVEAHAT